MIFPTANERSAEGRQAAWESFAQQSQHDLPDAADLTSLEDKLRFLKDPRSYGVGSPMEVVVHETHMSLVFLVGDLAFKLKKPVRFAYLDFSTLEKREKACRAELSLNRRLARGTYLSVIPLHSSGAGLSLTGRGPIADWLIVMRRLDPTFMLERLALERAVSPAQLDRLANLLLQFYRRAARPLLSAERYLSAWRHNLRDNRIGLQKPRFGLNQAVLSRIDTAQRRFLTEKKRVLLDRWRQGVIVEGHGDLRAEHVWLGTPITIFDCLEFNKLLRYTDPLDEIGQLSIECDRLDAHWIGTHIQRRFANTLFAGPDELFHFYCCYRATLKARLLLAHLLEPHPRTPEKWEPLARLYLSIADREARLLERQLRDRETGPRTGWLRHSGSRRPGSRLRI